ncbi:MAG: sulfurtransferase TusA family protein, partial [Candidatus Omnitrophica bacterium]|nr:sulfurtransferase TusA family protein [Candidatus Omnitrophota bacterium]
PEPLLKLAARSPDMSPGQIMEIIGDCPTFVADVQRWCERLNKKMVAVIDDGENRKRCKIQF